MSLVEKSPKPTKAEETTNPSKVVSHIFNERAYRDDKVAELKAEMVRHALAKDSKDPSYEPANEHRFFGQYPTA